MTYTELQALLQEYTQNSSTAFIAAIPDIVRLAEDRIYQSIQLPAMRKNSTSVMTINSKYLATPSDFLASYSMAVVYNNNYQYLLEKEVGFINESYPDTTTRGVPRYYAIFDNTSFVVAPTPAVAYPVELHYFYEPVSIVTLGTSWLGENYESLLFYGSLVEAYTYMKGDPDLAALYKGRYDEVLLTSKSLGEGMNKRDNFRLDLPRMNPI